MPDHWNFIANLASEIRTMGNALLAGPSATEFVEQFQITRLVQFLAAHERLDYPVKIRHTHRLKPDFQMKIGNVRIAVEVTRIASQNLEHAKALQETIGKVLSAAGFFRTGQPRLSRKEVIEIAFLEAPLSYPPTVREVRAHWCERFEERLTIKSDIQVKTDFNHGDQDWLVMWDCLGNQTWPSEQEADMLNSYLAKRWKKGWFQRVFVQDMDSGGFSNARSKEFDFIQRPRAQSSDEPPLVLQPSAPASSCHFPAP